MVSRPEARQGLMDFLGLPWDDRLMGLVAPANAGAPEEPAALTPAQAAQFDAMASDMMQLFGYERPRAQRAAL
jgi:hypothetical protein